MKWYIEEETKKLREALEKEILKWPKVDSKTMFGCPCYLANGKMFAGMVTKGIVITKLNSSEREEVNRSLKTKPFSPSGKIIKSWVSVELHPKNLKDVMPYVKKSYNRAIASGS